MARFKVRRFEDDTYEVIHFVWADHDGIGGPPDPSYGDIKEVKEFQGTLPECDAWIRLNDGGYM